jgi:cytoskeletal protein CcmA (bactofilin family)
MDQKTIISTDRRDKIEGDAIIHDDDICFHGIITGNLFIDGGININLSGLVAKDVIVSGDSEVVIDGTVIGTVSANPEAKVTIFGMVGRIDSPNITIAPSAVIRNRV